MTYARTPANVSGCQPSCARLSTAMRYPGTPTKHTAPGRSHATRRSSWETPVVYSPGDSSSARREGRATMLVMPTRSIRSARKESSGRATRPAATAAGQKRFPGHRRAHSVRQTACPSGLDVDPFLAPAGQTLDHEPGALDDLSQTYRRVRRELQVQRRVARERPVQFGERHRELPRSDARIRPARRYPAERLGTKRKALEVGDDRPVGSDAGRRARDETAERCRTRAPPVLGPVLDAVVVYGDRRFVHAAQIMTAGTTH